MEYGPRCRLCGYALKAINGCGVCTQVKAVLVWPAIEDANPELSAQEVINDGLRMIKRRLRKLQAAEKLEEAYDSNITRDLATMVRQLKELASEQRKLEDREEQQYAAMGIEGRMQLYAEQFFAQLPEDYQVRLLQIMRDTYTAQNRSLLSNENTNE